MKRLAVICFAGFYLLLSVGFAVNIHYCGGSIASVQLLFKGDSCCCGEKKANKGCCDNEQFFVQLDVEQQIQQTLRKLPRLFSFALPLTPFQLKQQSKLTDESPALIPPHPPPLVRQSRWLLHSALLFYG